MDIDDIITCPACGSEITRVVHPTDHGVTVNHFFHTEAFSKSLAKLDLTSDSVDRLFQCKCGGMARCLPNIHTSTGWKAWSNGH